MSWADLPTVHYVYMGLVWTAILLYAAIVLTILGRRKLFGGTFYTLTVAQVLRLEKSPLELLFSLFQRFC